MQELLGFNKSRASEKKVVAHTASRNVLPLPRAEALCNWCRYDEQQYVITSAETRRSGQISKPLSRLQEGAQKDCWVCKAFLKATALWQKVDHVEFQRLRAINVRFDAERVTIGAGSKLPKIQLFIAKGCPNVFRFNPDSELPSRPSSAQTMNFIAYNLNSCLHSHKACQRYQTQLASKIHGNWPSRILQIDAKTWTIRLVRFDPAAHAKYVALSYCWGDQKGQLTSNKSTLPKLRAGISVQKLPATLRDAVTVTATLGLRYIWIDSICIIQDDKDDWKQEAGKMSTVYAQSLVTIIASSADSCSEGFLEKDRAFSTEVSRVRVQHREAEVRARVLYDWGHHRGGPQSDESARLRWMDPVDSRAWTLQERVLSGRYINFTSGEAQWGCVSCRACECGQPLYGKLYETLPDAEKWFRIVEEYCTRNMKFATDKLVAIAGMARAMATVLQEKWYVAGLWLSPTWTPLTLQSFMWRRKIDSPLTVFYNEYIGPSFSWASHRGEPVHTDKASFSGCTFPSNILNVDIQLSTTDSFGSVKGACVRLRGPLIAAKLKWDSTTRYEDMKVGIKIGQSAQSYSGGCRVDGLLESVMLKKGQHAVRRRCEGSVAQDVSFENVDVYLLPILVRKLDSMSGQKPQTYAAGQGSPTRQAECILLARSLQFPGFERLGVYTISQWDKYSSTPCVELSMY
ncbi:hypothetical protein PFICI_12957 [Pestalotiopsis fici W106-1]|uniref:Heterokaryon incompatibility domain-containing protein n=1 Tax=Pestalotiopsis fici (strain W106-1 / CGMCC3.15140) TaxID=1229662 RepID=W3WQ76_PESFW|nr:uncharacterized protein PFICI_12957 [Pestalotiopsis fici W106-1]ETS76013.1 hypothetical protein PFICI_12957 [Pestalotiopsis fici W106-1]